MVDEAENLTMENTAMNLVIAFNYGARDEIARAAATIARAAAAGTLDPDENHARESCFLSRYPPASPIPIW